ncbi:uncharacterized protein SPSK_10604 [Sporothrix schenckii 1099-18]|uniref:Uncharacterized protein n=1 Tax=Sporothrix schenckii 1099-18 TaxID=1397361 RepID=A0A0F2M1M3_SPOSC|nr:uncharacterized protein SPSK_10604 [Sporothrix schenckii 1099-18]KJR83598.1 hypothetical protein SPSK_10604 [Sporothrix schenckii 1099-18]
MSGIQPGEAEPGTGSGGDGEFGPVACSREAEPGTGAGATAADLGMGRGEAGGEGGTGPVGRNVICLLGRIVRLWQLC